jgi:WW domain-containing oxidoreductase
MSLLGWFKGAGPNGFGYNSTAEQVTAGLDLKGKTFLVTGCNSGLGLETLRVLSLRGGHVIGTARTLEKARAALASVSAQGTPLACELEDPQSVRNCAVAVRGLGRPLDAILCNAGIMALPKLQQKHGLELQFLTNHVGHFILVTNLLEQLAPAGRVVVVSSGAHTGAPSAGIEFDNLNGARGYSAWRNYGQSKLANILFAKELARRFKGTGRTANALHPGVIPTNLARHMPGIVSAVFAAVSPLVLKTIPQGAATECYAVAHPAVASASGLYFADCNPARPSRHAEDAALAAQLWARTEEIVAAL